MIEKIKISNFKSIEELELDLGRINVLIGENGCGKTNILEGIGFGSVGLWSKVDNSVLSSKGLRLSEESSYFLKKELPGSGQLGIFEISYKIDSKDLSIYFYLTYRKDLNTRITLDNVDVFFWGSNEIFSENTALFIHADLQRIAMQMHKQNDDGTISESFDKSLVSDFIIYCPENTFLRRFEDEGQVKPLGYRGEGLFKELQKIIQNHPDKWKEIKEGLEALDWFENIEIPKDLFIAEKRIQLKDKYLGANPDVQFLDQRSANEGFLFLLFYFTLFVSDDTPKFFAIDNIDQALNPRLCIKLMQTLTEMAKKHDKQVIFTTHNPSILDGLDLKDDDQRLFVVYRNADGNTVAKRHVRKEGMPGVESARLSEAFIRGYLGGLPTHF